MADPLSIVTAVVSTASAIHTWLEQHESKNTTIRELRITVRNIYSIVSPLQGLPASEIERMNSENPSHFSMFECLADLVDALKRTHEHLVKWSERRGFRAEFVAKLVPSIVLGELAEDQKWLSQRCQDLHFAFSTTLWRKAFDAQTQSYSVVKPTKASSSILTSDIGIGITNHVYERDRSLTVCHVP